MITGNNKMVINEFFNNMDFSFECISTSNRYDDIVNHLKYINPDVFVYCLMGETPDEMKKFINEEREISKKQIPIVIIGESKDCTQLLKIAPVINPTVFQKPYSFQNIEEKIVEMLDNKKRTINKTLVKDKDVISKAEDAVKSVEKLLANLEAKEKLEGRRKHVLVVDDDSSVLKLVKGYLSSKYDVATAKSGKVAMKFLETKTTDMILLDYEMPDDNGATVLRKLRAIDKTKNIPVVFLTGVREKEKIQEVLSLNPRGYLLKPIDM
ncbi:MAG TPA: hypothetical protein DCZ23_01000, partial [Lachnospiraceae bacterium]|nr:hypothetical protein [Lachnospiraceae bacterium]